MNEQLALFDLAPTPKPPPRTARPPCPGMTAKAGNGPCVECHVRPQHIGTGQPPVCVCCMPFRQRRLLAIAGRTRNGGRDWQCPNCGIVPWGTHTWSGDGCRRCRPHEFDDDDEEEP